VTKKEPNLSGTISEAVSVATSVAYTRQEIQKLKTEFVSLLENKKTEIIVEQVPGPVGPRGAIGATGATGATGPRGQVGAKGEMGNKGSQGEVGLQGDVGPEGPQGEKGEQGEVGPQGEQGIQGVAGERGPQGPKGDRGEDGKNGLDGRDGKAGEVGPIGPIGAQGIQGERGPEGERGQDGQQGPAGPAGERGPQGVQGLSGKDGKDADIKSIEQSISQFKEVLQKDVSQYKAKVNTILSSGVGGGGGGEVNLRRLDDVDTTNLTDGYVLSFNESTQKFEFVAQSGGGGGTVDTIARARANSAWSTANSAYIQANTATTLAQAAYNQANTGGGAGTDTLARTTANSSWSTANSAYTQANSAYSVANSATTLAQAAYDQANTGAGASESLNVVFTNNSAGAYKIVALNANAETIVASSLDISIIDKILGVLANTGQTVTFGSITNPSWTWTPEQSLYLGSSGNIVTTSTIDGAAFSLKIGYAISSTKAFIKIGTPVVL
jgi:hypothetical protein